MGYFTASVEWAHNIGEPEAWKDWWYNPDAKIYNFLGKDNIPFHTVIWQAELLGVERIYEDDESKTLNLPYDVPANEYLNVQGGKFSKSENRAVWLNDTLDRYDPDAIRYVVTAMMPERSDTDFTWEDFVARNNNELVAWWGNLVNRVMKFAYKHWEGIVPDPGELGEEDRALLETIKGGFATVGDHLDEVRLRRALDEAMRLAREVNVYLDGAPWFGVIKEDKATAARTVYTALQAIANVKTLLAPFLPFTSQRVHDMLGYEGQLFGEQQVVTYDEATRSHEALILDASAAIGTWEPVTLPPGQSLGEPQPLFKKLDDSVIEEEVARFGS